MDVGQLVGGAFGGAVASSILGPMIVQRTELRGLRAAALRAVADVESKRWAPGDFRAYRDAVVTFRSEALVARVDRRVVERYILLSYVARQRSDQDHEELQSDEHGGGISPELNSVVRQAANLVVTTLWQPWRSRLSIKKSLAASGRAQTELMAQREDRWLGRPEAWKPPPF